MIMKESGINSGLGFFDGSHVGWQGEGREGTRREARSEKRKVRNMVSLPVT